MTEPAVVVHATATPDWNARVVDRPGGHVYQSRAWAAERAKLGWTPRFLMLGDDHGALVLTRPFPFIGGAGAYVPRGPVADPAEGPDAHLRVDGRRDIPVWNGWFALVLLVASFGGEWLLRRRMGHA